MLNSDDRDSSSNNESIRDSDITQMRQLRERPIVQKSNLQIGDHNFIVECQMLHEPKMPRNTMKVV